MLLEARSAGDIVRNAMVCVMLRLLEYHSGVLFLTSNRIEALDPAFQSRVQCALKYDELSATSRAQVWRNLMETKGLSEDGIDVEALSQYKLNGRQIKNALQLAFALAKRDGAQEGKGVGVSMEHLEMTVKLGTDFAEETK